MDQNIEREAVKRKIRALTEKTPENGATEHEALQAMEKVGDLLEQYNLSMDECVVREQQCIKRNYGAIKKRGAVEADYACALAEFCGVKVWLARGLGRTKTLIFFGLEADVELACYLTDYLAKAFATSLKTYKGGQHYRMYPGHRRTLTSNFQKGFRDRITARLNEIRREHEAAEQERARYWASEMANRGVEASEAAKAKRNGTELVSVAKAQHVEAELEKLGVHLRTAYRRDTGRHNGGARAAGAKAADRVNLNNPIASKGGASGHGGMITKQ